MKLKNKKQKLNKIGLPILDKLLRERERERVTPPLAKAMAIMAAHSMTHDRGFHMKPKNLRNLLSCNQIWIQ